MVNIILNLDFFFCFYLILQSFLVQHVLTINCVFKWPHNCLGFFVVLVRTNLCPSFLSENIDTQTPAVARLREWKTVHHRDSVKEKDAGLHQFKVSVTEFHPFVMHMIMRFALCPLLYQEAPKCWWPTERRQMCTDDDQYQTFSCHMASTQSYYHGCSNWKRWKHLAVHRGHTSIAEGWHIHMMMGPLAASLVGAVMKGSLHKDLGLLFMGPCYTLCCEPNKC